MFAGVINIFMGVFVLLMARKAFTIIKTVMGNRAIPYATASTIISLSLCAYYAVITIPTAFELDGSGIFLGISISIGWGVIGLFVYMLRNESRLKVEKTVRESTAQAHRLMKLIPDDAWVDTRRQLEEIARIKIPKLLSTITELETEIAAASRTISSLPISTTEFLRQQRTQMEGDLATLEAHRMAASNSLSECVTFLQTAETRFHVARRSVEDRDLLDARLGELLGEIQAASAADREVDEAGRKIVRLRPRSTPEQH